MFHHLPFVGSKQLYALAQQGYTRKSRYFLLVFFKHLTFILSVPLASAPSYNLVFHQTAPDALPAFLLRLGSKSPESGYFPTTFQRKLLQARSTVGPLVMSGPFLHSYPYNHLCLVIKNGY